MRIVHTADWHIGKFLNDYSLLEDQRDWFGRFCDRLAELRPDALLVAGDIYDRSVPPGDAIFLLNEILRRVVLELHIETFLIAGNHDSRERLSFGGELLEQSGLHIAGRISRELKQVPLSRGGLTVRLTLLPYVEPHVVKPLFPELTLRTAGDAVGALLAQPLAAMRPDEINLLVAHGLFALPREEARLEASEASAGGSEMVDASPLEAFDYVALGHLHSRRSAGSARMLYAGSPLKYSVDEAGQKKGFLVLDITSKEDIRIREETLPALRDVRMIKGTFDQLSAAPPESGGEDYVFANLTDGALALNAISRLKAVYPNIVGLRYVNLNAIRAGELETGRETACRLSEEELFEEFYKNVTGEALPETERLAAAAAFRDVRGGRPE